MKTHLNGCLRFRRAGAKFDEGPVARVVLVVDVACRQAGRR
jgi:hypothetical protein